MTDYSDLAPFWTSSVGIINTVIDTLRSLGGNQQTLIEHTGIDGLILQDPNNRLPLATLLTLLEEGAKNIGDPNFGLHVGRQVNPGSYSVLGYLIISCHTLREAFELLPKYRRIGMDIGRTELIQHDTYSVVSWPPNSPLLLEQRYLTDMVFSSWINFIQLLHSSQDRPLRVEFTYPEPEDCSLHNALFRENLHFDQPINRIFFDNELLDRLLSNANQVLFENIHTLAKNALLNLDASKSTSSQVKQLLTRLMPKAEATIDQVTKELSTNKRALQRQLSAEGTTFKEILQELRKELAVQYLNDPQLSVLDIALLLGYAENSAFTAAFRNWHGVSPTEFRNQQAQEDG